MPVAPILILIAGIVAVNIGVMALILVPPLMGRPSLITREIRPSVRQERRAAEAAIIGGGVESATEDGVSSQTYDRVVRIVSWIFLLTSTAVVAVTGLWPGTQPAILVLLAFSMLFVVVIHDLLPPDMLGSAKFVVEGSVAITVATLLVALTGGVDSPFFFAFPLIVGGAALVVTPIVTIALLLSASLGYLLAVVAGSNDLRVLGPGAAAIVWVNLTALMLLSYVAMVIARAQRETRDAAIRLSTVDSLTGLFNRAFFFAAMEREIARSARSGRGFCLLMMDLDELKAINDRLGHFHGDTVLRGVGEVITRGVRQIDTAARYGGDEFVVLLPETDPTGAFVVAEKIRIGVNSMPLEMPGGGPRPSLSIGVVAYPDDGRTPDELIISADGAMYTSKRAGKDRVTGVPLAGSSRPTTPV